MLILITRFGIVLAPFVSRLNELGFEWRWDDLPHLVSFWRKIQKRDSFRALFDALPNPARRRGWSQAGEEVHHKAIKIIEKMRRIAAEINLGLSCN